ncbi:MAG: hypothetical protein JWO91_2138 [Acidobacteriaceae bacterium]|nr:hypothetical protein [Acidobacteriaceae bacterium]
MRTAAEILGVIDHRPWELPSGSWVMMQGWRDLLFAHWPISVETLRPLIPQPLIIDTFEHSGWLGITPFDLKMRPRGLPTVSHFPELNCRTYVVYRDKPGVFFFSLDARSRLAVWGARRFFLLPYFYAKMKIKKRGGTLVYSSQRIDENASFVGQYCPEGPVRAADPGTLEHWLTERYCLYTYSHNRLFRGEIHHRPWPLQRANCEIAENTIAVARGISLPDTAPLFHFAAHLDVLVWPLRAA